MSDCPLGCRVNFNIPCKFICVLCKITTWSDQILRCLGNVNDDGQFFQIPISNSTLCSIFSFEIVLTMRNKLNDFTVSQDSQVKYKFIFKTNVIHGVAGVVAFTPYSRNETPHETKNTHHISLVIISLKISTSFNKIKLLFIISSRLRAVHQFWSSSSRESKNSAKTRRSMVARHAELCAQRYVLLGVLRDAQTLICFFRRFSIDSRDGLSRKGGTARDQIHRTIIRQITSEGEGNYLMTELSNSMGPQCYIAAVNATCTSSNTGRPFFLKWRLNTETFQSSS